MKTTEPEKRKLITRGNDHAFKMAVFRTLDWEPVIDREYSFKRSCGWRDGVVRGLVDGSREAKRVPVVVIRFWTNDDKFIGASYLRDKWFKDCAEGRIVRRKPFWER